MLAIRLAPEIEAELTALAKRTGRTKTFYAREAILNYLEDIEDARIADKRIAEFEESGDKGIPLAEVMKRYGVEP
jgi:RHH-type transcriptional regulator, rel operon repressor / antitoxin RelB